MVSLSSEGFVDVGFTMARVFWSKFEATASICKEGYFFRNHKMSKIVILKLVMTVMIRLRISENTLLKELPPQSDTFFRMCPTVDSIVKCS